MPDGLAKKVMELEELLVAQQATIDAYRLSSERMQGTIVDLQAELVERDERIAMMDKARAHCIQLIKQLEAAVTAVEIEKKSIEVELLISQLPSTSDDV